MNLFLSLFITLMTLTSYASAAEAKKQCRTYVVRVSPKNIPSTADLNTAYHLLSTPGLPIVDQSSYGQNGKMYLIEVKSKSNTGVIKALASIDGVVVTCEAYYGPNPHLTGSN